MQLFNHVLLMLCDGFDLIWVSLRFGISRYRHTPTKDTAKGSHLNRYQIVDITTGSFIVPYFY
jgi:hypothetical protein